MPVKKNECSIDGKHVQSLETLYGELSRQLSFPLHFGNNLDALFDVLTTDVAGPVHIVWNNAAVSRRAMGNDFETVVTLLRNVGKERKDFAVDIHE
jgi:ribonuclease inhibitor